MKAIINTKKGTITLSLEDYDKKLQLTKKAAQKELLDDFKLRIKESIDFTATFKTPKVIEKILYDEIKELETTLD